LRQFEKEAEKNTFGQVILTSHSPVVLEEVPARLHITRSGETVEVFPVTDELVPCVRKAPEAFLGTQVIVCEGKTEIGLCRAYDALLSHNGDLTFACSGVVPVDGGGSCAFKTAKEFTRLGYKVVFLGDSDTSDIEIKKGEMECEGISVQLWRDRLAIEQRVFNDLPWEGVLEALIIATDEKSVESITDSVASKLKKKPQDIGAPGNWLDSVELRGAIGSCAKEKGWYKRIDTGEALGRIVIKHLSTLATNDIPEKLEFVKAWSNV
jgi:hypothetical protein